MTFMRIAGVSGRPVLVGGVGLICAAGSGAAGATGGQGGAVQGFRARDHVPDRKSIKLMTRGVQLGVSAVRMAFDDTAGWQAIPPGRRAIYVGASPQMGDPSDLQPALDAACGPDGGFDLGRFTADGMHRIHPLWLIKGLSNNVLGFSSVAFDLQGTNSNYCDGMHGGRTALLEGARAVAEGRADLAVAGGADALVGAEAVLGKARCGEGAAFVVFVSGAGAIDQPCLDLGTIWERGPHPELGHLGAATWPVSVARHLLRLRSATKL